MTDFLPADPKFKEAETLFFVIGAQKCGTTWLHQFLLKHPEACVPGWKETNYWNQVQGESFSDRLNKAYKDRFRKLPVILRRFFRQIPNHKRQVDRSIAATYRAIQNAAAPHSAYADVLFQARSSETKAVGELCPQFCLLSAETYAEMAALSPHTKFILVMRDPVARLVSAAKHQLRDSHGKENVTPELIEKFLQDHIEWGRFFPIQMTSYHKIIARLEEAVPRDRIKYVFFETLFAQSKVDEICNFLGISNFDAALETKANADPDPSMGISDKVRDEVIFAMQDVYVACAEEFGDELPAAWRTSMARLPVKATDDA